MTNHQGGLCPRRRTGTFLRNYPALAEYDWESLLKKTRAGQLLAAARGERIGRPKGVNAEQLAKVRTAVERGLSVAETVSLTGISLSTVKRYRKQLEKLLCRLPESK